VSAELSKGRRASSARTAEHGNNACISYFVLAGSKSCARKGSELCAPGPPLCSTTFLSDPDKKMPFPIQMEGTAKRYLTGAAAANAVLTTLAVAAVYFLYLKVNCLNADCMPGFSCCRPLNVRG
jgi:hypothetical protein